MEDFRPVLDPAYTICFLKCKGMSCDQEWAAAGKFVKEDDPIPSLIKKEDGICPACKHTSPLMPAWGKRGCIVNKIILPGQVILEPRKQTA